MFTSLYLTKVLPASRPSATLKTMVMVGPSLIMRWMAMPMATTAARIGMIQTTEIRVPFFRTTVACGSSSRLIFSAMRTLRVCQRIPNQPGVKGLRRDHRQHHHRREKNYPRTGLDKHQRLELYQGNGECVDENIQHRPAPDELDHSIQPGALTAAAARAALHRDQEIGQRHQLAERDYHAGD